MAMRDFLSLTDPDGSGPRNRAGLLGVLTSGGENTSPPPGRRRGDDIHLDEQRRAPRHTL
jgi:hypothetical protein